MALQKHALTLIVRVTEYAICGHCDGPSCCRQVIAAVLVDAPMGMKECTKGLQQERRLVTESSLGNKRGEE
jgi:hypothetical protein